LLSPASLSSSLSMDPPSMPDPPPGLVLSVLDLLLVSVVTVASSVDASGF
jgi:hypothetical protein